MTGHELASLTEYGNVPRRALRGSVAGTVCVLPLYYGLWDALTEAGLRFDPYPAQGVPLIIWLALAGGLMGLGFGLLIPLWNWAAWKAGGLLGVALALVIWFVLAPLAGAPKPENWRWVDMTHTLTVFGGWGVALGLVMRWIPGGRAPEKPQDARPECIT